MKFSALPPPDQTLGELIASLRRAGLIQTAEPQFESLTGGVSSEIFQVQDGAHRFVVKRALARLRVADDWYADPSRSRTEQAYLRHIGQLLPGNVPRLLAADPHAGWLAIEYLDGRFANWKNELLAGRVGPVHAQRAGQVLGQIHRSTWGSAAMQREFNTGKVFRQLRIEPYLETSAHRVPELASLLRQEAQRLAVTSLALVHGDFSPKNMLVSPDRLVLLDAEAAWFGDPSFDAAFLLTHLYLKTLLLRRAAILDLAHEFWAAYEVALNSRRSIELEANTVRLLLCLLLARIHGKSPVEYLPGADERDTVTRFVANHLAAPPTRLADLTKAWTRHLSLG